MYYPSNNWYVVRQDARGNWQVESQIGAFYIPCPSRWFAEKVRGYLMKWLRNSHFYRLNSVTCHVHWLLDKQIPFKEFYRLVKMIDAADKDLF